MVFYVLRYTVTAPNGLKLGNCRMTFTSRAALEAHVARYTLTQFKVEEKLGE